MEHKMDWSLVVILSMVMGCATLLCALGKLEVTAAMPVFSSVATGVFALAMPRGQAPTK